MATIEVYTQALCGFCTAAKRLLTQKNLAFEEIDVTFKPDVRASMRDRAGGKNSTPQIFIGATHVGGCDDLFALEDAGKLDDLLKAEGALA
ncbi:MAG: glutaredoxin 3 [Pseudomonadota bacterium]